MEQTKKFNSRIYVRVDDLNDVQVDDVVSYVDDVGWRTRFVREVGTKTIIVEEPKGFKPSTRRINKKSIKEVYRWHKKT